MKLWLVLILLLGSLSARGAAVTPNVETNGWVVQWNVAGIPGTNGGHQYGWGANNTVTHTQSMVVTWNTLGFTWDGSKPVATVIRKTSYGTRELRWPYPISTGGSPVPHVEADGAGGVNIRSGIQDPICAYDTNLVFTVRANTYSNMSAIAATTLVNNSTAVSPAPFAVWAWPGMRQSTATLFLRANVDHWAARDGMPVCAMAFVVSDGTTTVTNWQRNQVVDYTYAVPTPHYEANVDVSGMTQGAQLRCDILAYPWEGTNVFFSRNMDATTNRHSYSQTNLCDRTGAYGNAAAVVDSINGNNTTGKVTPIASLSTNPLPFQTIAAASTAIKSSNSVWYGHLDVGGGWIFLTNGTHEAAAGTPGTNAWARLIVTNHPNATPGSVFIGSGDGTTAAHMLWAGATITNTTALGYWAAGGGTAWFDRVVINTTGAAFCYQDDANFAWYVTRSTITNINGNGGFRGYSTRKAPCNLIAGNTIYQNNCYLSAYCTVGNYIRAVSTATVDNRSGGEVNATPSFVMGNRWVSTYVSSALVDVSAANVVGTSIRNNVIECTNSASGPMMSVYADGIVTPAQNIIVSGNTVVGQRINYNYNDTGSAEVSRAWFALRNNLFDDYNIKADLFTGGTGANGVRIGNWASIYGVLTSGNNFRSSTIGAGLLNNTQAGFDGEVAFTSADLTTLQYVDRQSAPASGTDGGFGDYRLKSSSPALLNGGRIINGSPFDADGHPRSNLQAPGAYSVASPRRGD